MIFDFLKDYKGVIEFNGKKIKPEEIELYENSNDEIEIKLTPNSIAKPIRYKVVVKGWMYNNAANLDFHKRWNNGNPMPCGEMYGTVITETPGMWKMDLVDKFGENHWIGFVSKSAIIEMKEV